jgi:hypothetical protein
MAILGFPCFITLLKAKSPGFLAGTFQFLVCLLSISVPARTCKVKVVTVKICVVKFHLFFVFGVNVQVKMNLSIDNFIFLKIREVNRILFGGKSQ